MKHIIIPLDGNVDGLNALYFVFDNFKNENVNLKILWLGKRDSSTKRKEKLTKLEGVRLTGIPTSDKENLEEIILNQSGIEGFSIEAIAPMKITRKFLAFIGSYADSLIVTDGLYNKYFYKLFENKKVDSFQKSACPKIIIPNTYSKTDNIILLNFEEPNTSLLVKQFCYVFNNSCIGLKLNVLNVQRTKNIKKGEGTKYLLNYLQSYNTQPAMFKYSGEEVGKLKQFLNISKNTLWVSPLESTLELNLISNVASL